MTLAQEEDGASDTAQGALSREEGQGIVQDSPDDPKPQRGPMGTGHRVKGHALGEAPRQELFGWERLRRRIPGCIRLSQNG